MQLFVNNTKLFFLHRVACYKAGLENQADFGKWDRDYSQYQSVYSEYLGRPFGIEYSKERES